LAIVFNFQFSIPLPWSSSIMRFSRGMLLTCFVLLILSGCKPRAENEPIWIGHVASFSGPDKRIGEHARQAILLAVEEANKEGNRIHGRRVAVRHVDSHGDLGALQPEAVRLIAVNHVLALLGGADAAQVERLGQAAQPYDVALVTPAAVPPELAPENVFSINASLVFRGQVLARFAATQLKAERVAVFTDGRRSESTALAEAFNQEFSKVGGHLSRQWIYKSEAELGHAIEAAPAQKPEVILYAGDAAEFAKARALLQKAGLTMRLLFGGDEARLTALEADPNVSNGIYLATPYVLEGGTPKLQEFAKQYQQEFHEKPDAEALLSYDGVRVLFQAMSRTEALNAAGVRAALANSSSDGFESLTGRLVFNKDHSARRPLFVVRLENGKMHDAKRFDPEAP
jgi:branched-chain amino acid transport system substrate-binding protein